MCLQFASLPQAKNTQLLLHNSKQRAEGKTRHAAGQNKTAAALQQLSTLPSFTHTHKQSWTKPTTGPSSSLQVCKRRNCAPEGPGKAQPALPTVYQLRGSCSETHTSIFCSLCTVPGEQSCASSEFRPLTIQPLIYRARTV